MMDVKTVQQASALLSNCRETGKGWLRPRPLRSAPATTADGYAIQAELDNAPLRAGWKIAATSVAGQTHIGVDGRYWAA